HLGPGGKIAIGFASGLLMLSAGLYLARQDRYRHLALSFIGSGWATVYFTGYAMHGVAVTRIVRDPFTATLILLAISAAMLTHALSYRSEAGLASSYVLAFVSLNLASLSSFSLTATVLLALSMIFLALRLSFFRIALAGVVLTYGSFLLRYDSKLAHGQSILLIYWILFEAYDLLRLRRKRPAPFSYRTHSASWSLQRCINGRCKPKSTTGHGSVPWPRPCTRLAPPRVSNPEPTVPLLSCLPRCSQPQSSFILTVWP
ncbi:MAG: DUF2339 domain-containing protein, partial [Bryobacteraceae bacterium]